MATCGRQCPATGQIGGIAFKHHQIAIIRYCGIGAGTITGHTRRTGRDEDNRPAGLIFNIDLPDFIRHAICQTIIAFKGDHRAIGG